MGYLRGVSSLGWEVIVVKSTSQSTGSRYRIVIPPPMAGVTSGEFVMNVLGSSSKYPDRVTTDEQLAWIVIKDLCKNKEWNKARRELQSIRTHRLVPDCIVASLHDYVLEQMLS